MASTKVIVSRNREKKVRKTKTSEYAFQKRVLEDLKKLDIYVVKTVRSNRNGVPDILMCINGRFIGLELKRDGEKPDPIQNHHLKLIRESGGVGLWTCPKTWNDVYAMIYDLKHSNKEWVTS